MPRSPLADLLAVTAAAAIVPAALLAASSPALEVDGAADRRRTARHFSALVPTLLDARSARSARSARETGRAAAGPGAEGVTLALMVASVAELLDARTPSMPPGSAAAAPGGARATAFPDADPGTAPAPAPAAPAENSARVMPAPADVAPRLGPLRAGEGVAPALGAGPLRAGEGAAPALGAVAGETQDPERRVAAERRVGMRALLERGQRGG